VIVLDTNVVSAIMKDPADRVVVAWLDTLPIESVWTTAVTVFEVRFGLEILVPSRKRARLEAAFDVLLREAMENRILTFDADAAEKAAMLAAGRKRSGRPIEHRDTQIAGIVLSRGATLATRNVKDFPDVAQIVDPWTAKVG
jgi:predicted nucleic acid-binding protein